MSPKSLIIAGATGYIGSHLAASLRILQHNVYCLTGAKSNPLDVAFLKAAGANVITSHKLIEGINYLPRDADVLIHLIGSVEPKYGDSSKKLHLEPTKEIIHNCQKNNLKNLILISTLNADKDADTEYARNKWAQEELIKQSGLNYIIIRPALVIGRSKGIRDSKLVLKYLKYIQNAPFIPLINNGKNLIQPIFIDDLIQAIIISIDSLTETNLLNMLTLEVGGDTTLTFREFVLKLMQLNKRNKPIFNIKADTALNFISAIKRFSPNTDNLCDQILLASQNNICQNNDLASRFKITPTTLNLAIDTYR